MIQIAKARPGVFFSLMATFFFGLFSPLAGASSPSKPVIAVSVFPLYDIVRKLAGEEVQVELVLPIGFDEHHFDPTPRDVMRLSQARVFLAFGLGLDDWLVRLVETVGTAGGSKPRYVTVGMAALPKLFSVDIAGADPHVWLDPYRMMQLVPVIARLLSEMAPAHAALFANRSQAVQQKLLELDAQLVAQAKTWRVRRIITQHPIMGYFAARYGLEVLDVLEAMPNVDVSARQLARLHRRIHASRPVALFGERQITDKEIVSLAHDLKLPLGRLDGIGGLPGSENYEAMMLTLAGALSSVLNRPE